MNRLVKRILLGTAVVGILALVCVVPCFCGGVTGILVDRGISYLIREALRWPTELPLGAIAALRYE
jgi:hypothetical protein